MWNAKIAEIFRHFDGKKLTPVFECSTNECSMFMSVRLHYFHQWSTWYLCKTKKSNHEIHAKYWTRLKRSILTKKNVPLKSEFERVIRSIHILWGFRFGLLWQLSVPSNLLRNVLPSKLAIFVCLSPICIEYNEKPHAQAHTHTHLHTWTNSFRSISRFNVTYFTLDIETREHLDYRTRAPAKNK